MTLSSYHMLCLQKKLSRSVGSILNFIFFKKLWKLFLFFYSIEQLTLDDPYKKYCLECLFYEFESKIADTINRF